MNIVTDIEKDYFNWLQNLLGNNNPKYITFEQLMTYLHETEFTYTIPKDANRAEDGKGLRRRFVIATLGEDEGLSDELSGPCSVLEMMIALAFACEEIMEDPLKGDRTAFWFWKMINSLGLSSMYNGHFDEEKVKNAISRLLARKYEPNGRGGLFTVKNCEEDLRKIEIWWQACRYLDNMM